MSWFSQAFRRAVPAPPTEDALPVAGAGRRRGSFPERLTTLNFERFLKEHSRVVVDVWAPWCRPCRAFAPIFASAAGEHGDSIGFGKVHADHEPTLVARFRVRAIPSLLFFREGKLVRSETGVLSRDRLEKQLRTVFRDLP